MDVTISSTIATLVHNSPRAARVFSLLGIDYCCHADRLLSDAATAAGADSAEVLDLLLSNPPRAQALSRGRWQTAPLTEITGYIADYHHRRTRFLLVAALELIDQMVSAHSEKRPDLWRLKSALEQLARNLIPHMVREERFIFPYIEMIDNPVVSEKNILIPLTGTVEYPLHSIRHDHTDDLSSLTSLRELRHASVMPAGGCNHFAELESMLAELDRDLTQHIELENDVLFPRAVELEQSLAKKGAKK